MIKRGGFTLIELMVTVSIIAILTGMAGVSYSGIQARGRDAQRVNDLNQIKIALSTYYNSRTPVQYPASQSPVAANGANATITINGSTDLLSVALESGGFMASVPVDPVNSSPNVYKYLGTTVNSVTTNFTLLGTLENKNNKRGWNGTGAWVADGYSVTGD